MRKNWKDIDTTTKVYIEAIYGSKRKAEKFVEEWNEVTEELMDYFTRKKKDAKIKS